MAFFSAPNRLKRLLLWGGLPALLLSACHQMEKTDLADLKARRAGEPLSRSYQVEFLYTDSAKIKARVRTQQMEEIMEGNPPKRITLANGGLEIIFYDAQGKPESRLTSERGRFDNVTDVHEALGNVVVVNEVGDIMETERLIWEQRKDRIYTNEFVKITRPGEIILADSLETNSRFAYYNIYQIRGVIQVEE